MTDYKTHLLNRNNFQVLAHTREAPRPQFTQERSRYILISQHQPDQTPHKSFEQTPTAGKAGLKLSEATQGLKALQDKIDFALKRSASATSIRPQHNAHANPLGSVLNQSQYQAPKVYQAEAPNETMESFYESKSRVQPASSYKTTVKVLPNDMGMLPKERVVNFGAQTPQASSSTSFYLGGLNPNGRTREELLNSIKNYQVKTVQTLDSSRKHYNSQNTTQNIPERNHGHQNIQNMGASVTLKNFTTQVEYQPGYDKVSPSPMLYQMVPVQQNYTPARQDSFLRTANVTNVTNYDSHANSRVYESRGPREHSREMTPQYYYPRPLQVVVNKAPPAQMVYQRHVKERNAPTRTEQSILKKSNIGEIEADGDSMICDFLKENDDLLDFEEEMKPKRKTREVDSESQLVRKVPRRQEIMESKRQVRREPNNEQAQRQRKEISYKNNGSELAMKNKRRI